MVEILEEVMDISQHFSEGVGEQRVDVPVPHVAKEILEVITGMRQERTTKGIGEEIEEVQCHRSWRIVELAQSASYHRS